MRVAKMNCSALFLSLLNHLLFAFDVWSLPRWASSSIPFALCPLRPSNPESSFLGVHEKVCAQDCNVSWK